MSCMCCAVLLPFQYQALNLDKNRHAIQIKYLLFKLAMVKEETERDTERLYLTGSLIEGAVHLWNNLLFK